MASTHDYEIDSRNDNIQIYIDGQFFQRADAKVSVMEQWRYYIMRVILITILFSNFLFPVGGVIIFNDGTNWNNNCFDS